MKNETHKMTRVIQLGLEKVLISESINDNQILTIYEHYNTGHILNTKI